MDVNFNKRATSVGRWMRYSLRSEGAPKSYKYMNDYNNTSFKKCKQADEENEYVFSKNIKLYNRTSLKLTKKNAIFGISQPPPRPRAPSNTEIFEIFQRRKRETNNKDQTLAVLYLIRRGYKLVVDPPIEDIQSGLYAMYARERQHAGEQANPDQQPANPYGPSLMGDDTKFFEPYMAIGLATRLSKERNEDFRDHSKYIKSLMHRVAAGRAGAPPSPRRPLSRSNSGSSLKSLCEVNEPDQSRGRITVRARSVTPNSMVCPHPEQHNVDDKINHFNQNQVFPHHRRTQSFGGGLALAQSTNSTNTTNSTNSTTNNTNNNGTTAAADRPQAMSINFNVSAPPMNPYEPRHPPASRVQSSVAALEQGTQHHSTPSAPPAYK